MIIPQEVGIMKTYIEEIEEKEEKRKVAEANREKKALLAMAPKRRSGRLTVSCGPPFFFHLPSFSNVGKSQVCPT